MNTFATRLKGLMEAQELTQSDLAARIWGRYENTEGKYVARGRDRISVWLAGKSAPSKANLEKLAEALGVEPSELMPAPATATKPLRLEAGGQVIIQIVAAEPEPLWSRDRMAAWMVDHCLDGEEPYPR